MKKLVNGIVDFRKNIQPDYIQKFSQLARGQRPDALFIACSDSRVVPNVFASTDPGDLFVVRNVGNLVPCCGADGLSKSDESEAAAIEFAVSKLNVSDIIICGHSDCGAMHAIKNGRSNISALTAPNLKSWLRHGEVALNDKNQDVNELSKVNVLQQLENLKTYPVVQERLELGNLALHAWWFDLQTANVLYFSKIQDRFVIIDEIEAKTILAH